MKMLSNFSYWQILLNTGENAIEQAEPGYGKGIFVIIKSIKI